jgi:hypothetical protein
MIKKWAVLFGVVFVIVGALGFIPNPIVGSAGIFRTDVLHNIVHLLVGIVLLLAAKSESASALWLKIWGAVYLVLFLDGIVQVHMNGDKLLGIVTANPADTYLHLVLGIVLLIVGFVGGKSAMSMDKSTM